MTEALASPRAPQQDGEIVLLCSPARCMLCTGAQEYPKAWAGWTRLFSCWTPQAPGWAMAVWQSRCLLGLSRCAKREGHHIQPSAGLAAWQEHTHRGAQGEEAAEGDKGLGVAQECPVTTSLRAPGVHKPRCQLLVFPVNS